MNVIEKIPTSIIGLLSQIFPDRYTQADIDALFLFSGAPEPIPDGSKATKVQAWLRQINLMSNEPLKILGSILDDFLEKQSPGNTFWLNSTDDHVAKLAAEKDRIRETLTREGLTYVRGGNIVKGGAVWLCPEAWCKNTDPRRVRGGQAATTGRLIVGLWLMAANPSSVM